MLALMLITTLCGTFHADCAYCFLTSNMIRTRDREVARSIYTDNNGAGTITSKFTLPVRDFLSDVHFSDLVTLRNVRWTYCACAMIGQYGAVVWCEWLSVLSLLTEPRTRCRCSASNFPLSMTPSSSCPYLCLFSRPCSSSVAVQA